MEHNRTVPHTPRSRPRPIVATPTNQLGFALDHLRSAGWTDAQIWTAASGDHNAVIELARENRHRRH